MKRFVLVGVGVLVSCFIGGGNLVFAEEGAESVSSVEAVLQESDSEGTDPASSGEMEESLDSDVESEHKIRTKRESLLEFTDVSKELLDSLTDAQLEELYEVTIWHGAQSIGMFADLVVKVYGQNPIPKEAYSTNYSALSIEELKSYLPQIRSTLIYVFDVPAQVVESVSDEELTALIDALDVYPLYYIITLANKINNGEYGSSADSVTQESTKITDTTASSETEDKGNEKKKGFPMTGDQSTGYLLTAGITLIGAVILVKKLY